MNHKTIIQGKNRTDRQTILMRTEQHTGLESDRMQAEDKYKISQAP